MPILLFIYVFFLFFFVFFFLDFFFRFFFCFCFCFHFKRHSRAFEEHIPRPSKKVWKTLSAHQLISGIPSVESRESSSKITQHKQLSQGGTLAPVVLRSSNKRTTTHKRRPIILQQQQRGVTWIAKWCDPLVVRKKVVRRNFYDSLLRSKKKKRLVTSRFFLCAFSSASFSELLKSRVFSICRAFFLRPFFEFS